LLALSARSIGATLSHQESRRLHAASKPTRVFAGGDHLNGTGKKFDRHFPPMMNFSALAHALAAHGTERSAGTTGTPGTIGTFGTFGTALGFSRGVEAG